MGRGSVLKRFLNIACNVQGQFLFSLLYKPRRDEEIKREKEVKKEE